MDRAWQLLVVEDNPADVDLLRESAAAGGAAADVTWAGTLREALALARSGTFDLMLLDLGLPDSDGMDTLRAVVQSVPELPVVVNDGPR